MAMTLSGGEQQMVAIGRGLMAMPRILMLDEPSLGLAPVLVNSIFETIRKIADRGTTVLLVEQDVNHSLIPERPRICARARPRRHGGGRCRPARRSPYQGSLPGDMIDQCQGKEGVFG